MGDTISKKSKARFQPRSGGKLNVRSIQMDDIKPPKSKLYTLYLNPDNGKLTVKSVEFDKGIHRVALEVRAINVRQAYAFVNQGVTADKPGDLGVVRVVGVKPPREGGRWYKGDEVEFLGDDKD